MRLIDGHLMLLQQVVEADYHALRATAAQRASQLLLRLPV
jgi:hypothetical protein